MVKKIACADGGHKDCTWTAEADSEEELLKQVAEHAAEAHGMKEISAETAEKVKAAIKDE